MLPGQPKLLHSFTSRFPPTHSIPPYAGLGLSQSLVLTFMPEPQLWLQASSLLHSPQFPSTVKWFQLDKLAKKPDNVLYLMKYLKFGAPCYYIPFGFLQITAASLWMEPVEWILKNPTSISSVPFFNKTKHPFGNVELSIFFS